MARKLSAYNKFVKSHFKNTRGATMKSAARAWRAKGNTKSRPRKSTSKVKKRMPKKKKTKRRGSRILGTIGLKGALIGGLTYFGVSKVLPPIGGPYAPAVTKIITGVTAKAVGVPGAILSGAGLIEAAAIGIDQIMTGGLALPWGAPGAGNGQNGGYDY